MMLPDDTANAIAQEVITALENKGYMPSIRLDEMIAEIYHQPKSRLESWTSTRAWGDRIAARISEGAEKDEPTRIITQTIDQNSRNSQARSGRSLTARREARS